jgi:hypothetical protein
MLSADFDEKCIIMQFLGTEKDKKKRLNAEFAEKTERPRTGLEARPPVKDEPLLLPSRVALHVPNLP